jgi:hypothetical protein
MKGSSATRLRTIQAGYHVLFRACPTGCDSSSSGSWTIHPPPADEGLGVEASLLVGTGSRRMLAEVRGRSVEDATQSPVEGELGTPDRVDRDSRGVR